MAKSSLLRLVSLLAIFTVQLADCKPMKPKIPLKYFKCANLVFEEETDATYVECKQLKKVTDEDAYKLRQMQRKYVTLLDQIEKVKTKTSEDKQPKSADPKLEELINQSQTQYVELMGQIQKYDKVAKDFEKIVGQEYFVYKLDPQNIQAPPTQ